MADIQFGSGAQIQSMTGAAALSAAKIGTSQVVKTLKTELWNTDRIVINSQGPSGTMVVVRGYGNCNLPDGAERPLIIGYLNTAMYDDWGEPNEGAPEPNQDAIDYSTSSGNDVLLGVPNPDPFRNRHVTQVHGGDGIAIDPYGRYNYVGTKGTYAAKSVADSKVKKPKIRVKIGQGLTFSDQPNSQITPPTSTDPNDHGRYITLDLDDNGGLIFKGDKVAVNPDGVTTKIINNKLVATGVTQTGGQTYEEGKGITFTQDPSQTYSTLINTELAAYNGVTQAGLCDEGGDDGKGLMVNLVSASGNSSVLAGSHFSRYPSFLPLAHRSTYDAGHQAYLAGDDLTANPHGDTVVKTWWNLGWKAGKEGRRYTALVPLDGGGSSVSGSSGGSGFSGAVDVSCTGVLTGSGLTIVAGKGNSLAIWLAHIGGIVQAGLRIDGGDDGEGLTINLADCTGDVGPGLTLSAGTDANGLAVIADPNGAIAVNCNGVATLPDLTSIIINNNDRLQAIGLVNGQTSGTGGGGSGTGGGGGGTGGTTSSCLVYPQQTSPGTTGPSPVPGGTQPGPVNAGKTGYTCSGAATQSLGPGSYGGSDAGSWNTGTVTQTTDGFTVMMHDAQSNAYFANIGTFWTWEESFVAFKVDLSGLGAASSSHPFGGCSDGWGVLLAQGDLRFSYLAGITWNANDRKWYWNGSGTGRMEWCGAGDVIGPFAEQPGDVAWIALHRRCDDGTIDYYLGATPQDLVKVHNAGGPSGSGTYLAFRLFDSGTSCTISNIQFYNGIPQSFIYDNGSGATTGGQPTPPASIPPASSYAYIQGWNDYLAGVPQANCPYAGATANPALCAYWRAGWVDSYNYWQSKNAPGGTGTPPAQTAPACPPSVTTAGYCTQWQAGYNTALAGQPQTCPYATDPDPNKCTYWNQGWTDATNAKNAVVDSQGKVTGWLPGGSTESETCLQTNSGSSSSSTNPIPIQGNVNIGGDLSVSGCITASCLTITKPITAPNVPPMPGSTDNGKVLTVVNGQERWVALPADNDPAPVTSINGGTGAISVAGAGGITVSYANGVLTIDGSSVVGTGGGGGGGGTTDTAEVLSLNAQTGDVVITGINGITVTTTTGAIQIDGSGLHPTLESLSDVDIVGLLDGQRLGYNGATHEWTNVDRDMVNPMTAQYSLIYGGVAGSPVELPTVASRYLGTDVNGKPTWLTLPTSSGGVASLNALTGALSITSTDGSVTITPSGTSIDLSVATGGGSVATATTTVQGKVLVDLNDAAPVAITKKGLLRAPATDATKALIQIGNYPFDGTSGAFVGSAGGTFIGINASPPGGSAYAAAVAADTPLLWWRVDETTGTSAQDSSGNGRTGTYKTGAVLGHPGSFSASAYSMGMTGGGQRIRYEGSLTGLPTGNAPFSIECMAKLSAGGCLWNIGTLNNPQTMYVYLDNSNVIHLWNWGGGNDNDRTFTASVNLVDGSWHHVVYTYDGTTERFYIDKVQQYSSVMGIAFNIAHIAGNAYSFGCGVDGSSPVVGDMDEISVYGTALSSARVAAHYDGAANVPSTFNGDFLNLEASGISRARVSWTGDIVGRSIGIIGKPGATLPSGYIGRTDGNHPTIDTYQTGDWSLDLTTPAIWACTAGGAPGTWEKLTGATTLAGLTDVNTPTPGDGNLLQYQTSDNKWHALAAIDGGTF